LPNTSKRILKVGEEHQTDSVRSSGLVTLASTFILVLNWWVERKSTLSPREVNELFRAMILPTLAKTTD
jgi:hypothetical protein